MKVCIIGNGLVSLTLAKVLTQKEISVDILSNVKSCVGRWITVCGLLITRASEKYFAKYTQCFFDAPFYKVVSDLHGKEFQI